MRQGNHWTEIKNRLILANVILTSAFLLALLLSNASRGLEPWGSVWTEDQFGVVAIYFMLLVIIYGLLSFSRRMKMAEEFKRNEDFGCS